MPEFRYIARDASGAERTDVMWAESRAKLIDALRAQGLLVLRFDDAGKPRWTDLRINPVDYWPMRSGDVELALEQISIMLRNGVSLLTALQTLSDQSRHSVRTVWEEVIRCIEGGGSFGKALAQHRAFPGMTVQLTGVGEQSGHLDEALTQAAADIARRRHMRGQLVSALAYPSFVLVFAIGITAFMLGGVIPELQKFLAVLGRKLPPITQSLLDMSNWFVTHVPAILMVAFVLIAAFILAWRWPPGRMWLDQTALRLPLFGKILRLAGTALFARSLGTLIKSGVNLVDALTTVEKLNHNRFLAHCVAEAREQVLQGSMLSKPLAKKHAYMPLLPRMVAVGEASGALDEVLHEVSKFHEAMLQKSIARLSAILGPMVVLIVGGIVGFVYAAFLIGLFSASGGGLG